MRFVFFGPPGAGKGTMAVEASSEFSLPHVSTGDLFRSAIRKRTPLGLYVKTIIDAGSLVPDQATIDLVKERLAQPDARSGWLLDGFPRTIGQAQALSDFCPENWVIDLQVSDPVLISRLSGRRMCSGCSHSYHMVFKQPKIDGVCDACGSPLYIRDDDREASVRNRLLEYRSLTEPLVDYYREKGNLVMVNGEGDPKAVWASLKQIMLDLHALKH
ncbi:MAG TPA: adenylate kinase [Spirochaetales bacterium]|nr:adenylate kinase [Spirochaetales bacterium]